MWEKGKLWTEWWKYLYNISWHLALALHDKIQTVSANIQSKKKTQNMFTQPPIRK